jgi:hypothetical protein
MAPVWYRPVTALLIRRRRPVDEAPGPTRFGTAGAGRIVQSLGELGVALDRCQQLVLDAGEAASTMNEIDLGERFAIVVLGSHVVNVPDARTRRAFLGVARRHLSAAGVLLVEHHPLDWAQTAAEVQPTPGSSVGMVRVLREPPFVTATSVYDIGGRWFEQPFRARVLSEAELDAALAGAGLARARRLGPTWLEATQA